MTIDQVLVFHEIVRLGSFKAAAAELHRTQPAISFAIKKLEEELEAPLFDRSGYRPVLTEQGRAFYERSQQVKQSMEEITHLAQSFKNKEEPEISLSVDGISPLPVLLKHFKKFGQRFPNTKLNLSLDILSEVERKVLGREAQFGITHFISESSALEIVPIATIEMVPVINPELFKEAKVKGEDDLLKIDQIVVADPNPKSNVNFGLMSGGKKWRLKDSNFKRELLLAGMGWGHLPLHTIEGEIRTGKLMVMEFDHIRPRSLDIKLIRLRNRPLGVVARTLWEELTSWHE